MIVQKTRSATTKPNKTNAWYRLVLYFNVNVLLRSGTPTNMLVFYSYDNPHAPDAGLKKLKKLAKSFDNATMLKCAMIYDNLKEGKPEITRIYGSYNVFDPQTYLGTTDGEIVTDDGELMEAGAEPTPAFDNQPKTAPEPAPTKELQQEEEEEEDTTTKNKLAEAEPALTSRQQSPVAPKIHYQWLKPEAREADTIEAEAPVREIPKRYEIKKVIDFAKELIDTGEIQATLEEKQQIWELAQQKKVSPNDRSGTYHYALGLIDHFLPGTIEDRHWEN